MEIREWAKQNQTERILVTKSLSYGRELTAVCADAVFGVRNMSMDQLARTVVSHAFASEKKAKVKMISAEYGAALLRKVLLSSVSSFSYYTNSALLNQAGADEIYRMMNLLRNSSCTDREKRMQKINPADHDRINDLFLIRDLYEQELQRTAVLDPAGVMHLAAEYAESMSEDVLFFAEIAVLKQEEKYFSYDERRLIRAISSLCNSKHEAMSLDLPDHFLSFLRNEKPSDTVMSFGRGFGTANEIKHVIYDILKNDHAYGDTCILYASQSMEPWLISELEAASVPYAFADGRSLSANPLILLIRAMLAWAADGFSLQDFAPVLKSSLHNRTAVIDGEEKVLRADRLLNDMVSGRIFKETYMIGWGFERYEEYLRRYAAAAAEKEGEEAVYAEYAVGLLQGILELFDDGEVIGCGEFAERLLQWTEANIAVGSMAMRECYSALVRMKEYLVFADIRMPVQEVWALVDQQLGAMMKTEEENGEKVLLKSMGHPQILHRPHVYAIGMSASNMSGSTDESPVLTDEEMRVLLDGSYLPCIDSESVRRREEILMTLGSMNQGTLYISYPDYDTQDMNLRNPAVMVLDLQAIAGQEKTEGFAYGIPRHGLHFEPGHPQTALSTAPSVFLNSERAYSATALEALADCPRAWYYDRVCHLGEEELPERQANAWLDQRMRGNFIHAVLEEYAQQVFGSLPRNQYPKELNEKVLDDVIAQVHEKTRDEIPDAEEWIVEREVRQMREVSASYLKTVHRDYVQQGWEFVTAELSFAGAYLNAGMDYCLNGRIDRIDCRLHPDRGRIELRTVDYKTGKPDNVRKKIQHGTALQKEVYTSALSLPEVQAEIRSVLQAKYEQSFDDWMMVPGDFFYVFPMTPEDPFLAVLADDSFSLSRLKAMTEAVHHKGSYPDRYTVGRELEEQYGETAPPDMQKIFDAINGEPKKRGKGRKKTDEKCTYCPFAVLCDSANV